MSANDTHIKVLQRMVDLCNAKVEAELLAPGGASYSTTAALINAETALQEALAGAPAFPAPTRPQTPAMHIEPVRQEQPDIQEPVDDVDEPAVPAPAGPLTLKQIRDLTGPMSPWRDVVRDGLTNEEYEIVCGPRGHVIRNVIRPLLKQTLIKKYGSLNSAYYTVNGKDLGIGANDKEELCKILCEAASADIKVRKLIPSGSTNDCEATPNAKRPRLNLRSGDSSSITTRHESPTTSSGSRFRNPNVRHVYSLLKAKAKVEFPGVAEKVIAWIDRTENYLEITAWTAGFNGARGNANDESLVANSDIDAWWVGAKEELVKYGALPKELGGNRRSRSPFGYAGMDEEIVWDE